MKEQFDVVVVGGGMVGSAVACCLGGSELKVAVIEAQVPEAFSSEQPHDLRVSALSIASKNILETVGAWEGVTSRRYCPFKRMRVWETAGDTTFNSDDIRYPELGYIVENRITQLALLDRLPGFDNIELLMPQTITKINYDGHASELVLADGRVLQAKLLVAADGGQSRVRQAVGLGVTSWDYGQHALVIYIETAYPQQDITWQRFVSSGPQAFLPLTGNYGSIVWYQSPDEVRRLQALPYEQLRAELVAAFPDCLGEVKQVLGVASFPLKRQHAQRYVKQGVALVGDAAHMINPLAGQGVNIGLLDAAALAEILVDAYQRGKDIADLAVLQRYEAMRRNENLKMMTLMDVFYRSFSNDILPLKLLRNLGLGLAQRITPARNKAMKAAMGLEGRLPKLARGEHLLAR
ncbi:MULTISPECIES: UbiH/UbiF/VisC/COQ6 family ubiquinone biosynthesis hydroxylase [Methylomonas]|uniref:2-octaprenyl-3-methyl-6-methoxy-1,4-benzoquinol hydroxylase n=2 Tax=Methylomonas TaxID=416 RepID=A0A140E5R3_9GAMM|nr:MULTISPECIES: UbiH/UbiF/VisC/COQ6 family ubiquinone biosynthesis hydroxylase [Methylomonas]AMK78737.1 2-octaprenyl-3-methyl-6-methoxy-1,4-benzoquinol hydroxylase [Methylomonas denitrificans]OAH99004.1 2-octaprenyl-3-methyl-6-methoxy-1,4-benzoquinol hydroxylase [Methylomonas methanica]TCV83509.1 2-octaprenyl-3-methyl-6-methoxy-1,4-benzoquinol hydroxylase [Methylomonas methanica]